MRKIPETVTAQNYSFSTKHYWQKLKRVDSRYAQLSFALCFWKLTRELMFSSVHTTRWAKSSEAIGYQKLKANRSR